MFSIVKLVSDNLEHVPASLEYSPAIDYSNFMHQKMFPLFLIVASKIITPRVASKNETQRTNAQCMHNRHSHSRYWIHKLMKTSSLDPVIGTVDKVPIQAKMDDDDKYLDGFHFGSSRESELDPPLVLESVWDCPGIILDTTVDDDGKTIPGWRCGYCLIPGNHGGPRFFKHRNASKTLAHLTKGKDIVTCTGWWNIPAKVVDALTTWMCSKTNRKHNIAVLKNNLNEEVEQQQDRVLAARIDR
jgi:hypothetical protein